MKHSAVLATQNHAIVAQNVLPGNPQLAVTAVMIHDVSLEDALKISAMAAAHGLSPLDWEPSIYQPTAAAEEVPVPRGDNPPPATPSPEVPNEPST